MVLSSQLKAMIIERYNIMFNDQEPDRADDISYVSSGSLMRITRYIEATVFKLVFLEQNPNKQSIYGNRAKQGSKIMWVIAGNVQTHKERWLGRVEDGTWYPK